MQDVTQAQPVSATTAPGPSPNPLDRFFHLTERGTSAGREMLAGATTFAAMAYIIAVNPAIMSNAGMDRADLVSATALAAIFGSVMMGLSANLPLAVAPAMGSNVIFTYVIVKQMGMPWQGALAMVAITGVLFLALSLSKLRERVAQDVPETLKVGIQAAVGTLIVFIALRGAGFVVSNQSTYIAMGSLRSPPVLLTLAGLLLTPVLIARRIPGALIISIAALTLVGLVVPGANGRMVTSLPSAFLAWPRWPSSTFMAMDVGYLVSHILVALPLLFYFLCAEFFSTLGTLIGVTGAANLQAARRLDPERHGGVRDRRDRIDRGSHPRDLGGDGLYRIDHRRAGRRPHRPDLADGRGLLLSRAVLLADLRGHPAASHRAGAGAGRRADDAGLRSH